jgi:hypothetical protein
VHRVRPELVAKVIYLAWTEENLLRQVVYQGLREDKPAAEVRRPAPYPQSEPSPAARSNQRRPKSLPVPRENILRLLPDAVVTLRIGA